MKPVKTCIFFLFFTSMETRNVVEVIVNSIKVHLTLAEK